jgi:hypothetical protein
MVKKSFDGNDLKDEIFSAKSAAYFIGIIVFGVAALLVVHNY